MILAEPAISSAGQATPYPRNLGDGKGSLRSARGQTLDIPENPGKPARVWLRPGCQVRNRPGPRPGPGPGTKHDQRDRYQNEHYAADEQADTDRERVRDGQIQPPAKATGAAASVFIATSR
jgi:hypothetical protein